MNYLQLCQQLVEDAGISGLFESTQSTTGENSRVVNWVARACSEIEATWFDWDFLYTVGEDNIVTTVQGTRDYFAPVDLNLWDTAAFIKTADQYPLEYMQWIHVKNVPTLSTDGEPYAFTVMPDKRVRLFGTPLAPENIEFPYWRKPTVLLVDEDIPAIPEQFHDIIVYKALQYYANYESADEVKQQALEAFQVRMRQLESHAAPGRQGHGNVNTGIDIQVLAEGSDYGY